MLLCLLLDSIISDKKSAIISVHVTCCFIWLLSRFPFKYFLFTVWLWCVWMSRCVILCIYSSWVSLNFFSLYIYIFSPNFRKCVDIIPSKKKSHSLSFSPLLLAFQLQYVRSFNIVLQSKALFMSSISHLCFFLFFSPPRLDTLHWPIFKLKDSFLVISTITVRSIWCIYISNVVYFS